MSTRSLRKALGGSAFALLLLTSCAQDPGNDAAAEPTTITQAAARSEQQNLQLTLPGTLAHSFQQLQGSWRGHLGMAVMPVGGTKIVSFGDWSTGPAWSTMKVPLTLAAVRRSPANAGYTATTAITQSDNTAADTLWQSLGGAQEAAKAVEAVLREGGDTKTVVPPTRTRAEHSSFGQAEWSLSEQVRFAAKLPCLPQASTVLSMMAQIIPNHRWGLGTFTGAEFKGGWGPDTSGAYLVRQFGLIDTAGGQIAVAFAAQPDSGTFNDGMTALDKMAALLTQHLDELAGGKCAA
ncbi:serine hydrolase [Nocardia goodfellowii]